jgi:hypothetical protein
MLKLLHKIFPLNYLLWRGMRSRSTSIALRIHILCLLWMEWASSNCFTLGGGGDASGILWSSRKDEQKNFWLWLESTPITEPSNLCSDWTGTHIGNTYLKLRLETTFTYSLKNDKNWNRFVSQRCMLIVTLFRFISKLNVASFWNIAPWGSYVNGHFRGMYHIRLQGWILAEQETSVQQVVRQNKMLLIRATIRRPVSLCARHPLGAIYQIAIVFLSNRCLVLDVGRSLTRGRVCTLQCSLPLVRVAQEQ